ncbi:MAG: gliding motility-associated C-terminal domain-containing protein, partial [Bacteroidota bacterium]
YLSCDYKTELSWNPYISMRAGVKEYQVFYSVDNGAFTKIATTTLTAFTHTGVAPGKSVCYFVRAVNNAKTITSSSNRALFVAYLVHTPNYMYMPAVSVVDKTTVEIKILIDTSKESNGIDLMRSEDGTNFKAITFIPYGGSPNLIYNDDQTEPFIKSYYYKAQLRDSCGNSRIESNVCKSMLLQVKDDESRIYTKHLTWSAYEGFAGGLRNYRVYRVVNDVLEPNAIATTTATVTKYNDDIESISNRGAKIEYYVEAIENFTGNPFGITEKSRSNVADVYMEGSIFIPSAFAPNGSNKTWLPITNFIDKSDYLIRVFDRWGHQVFQTNNDTEAWDGSNLPGDVYVYIISYKNARGEYKEAKGTVLLMK